MKNLLGIGIVLLLYQFTVQSVSAHVLKSDSSVGAIIHLSPEDDPGIGEETNFYFEFKDKEGKFKPENCDCKGLIIKDGKEIYSVPLFQSNTSPNLESESFVFTFPEKDMYKVQVRGEPLSVGSFEPFILSWDIRVERESQVKSSADTTQTSNRFINWFTQNVALVIVAIIAVVLIIFSLIKKRR